MQARVKDITAILEDFAPSSWAEEWDNPGLQVGSFDQTVERVYLCVDATLSSIKRAREANAQLLITHHPLIFQPQSSFDLDSPLGKTLYFAMENRVSVYSAHTNLDVVQDGVSGALAERLDLIVEGTLEESKTASFCRIAINVTSGREEEIWNLVFKANRSRFTDGSLQFRGICVKKREEDALKIKMERNPVSRVEFQVPCIAISSILRQIRELNVSAGECLEITELENLPCPVGYGVIGGLKRPLSFKGFISLLKEQLQIPYLQAAGPLPDKIRRVALCGGSGSCLLEKAFRAGADVYVTSEVKHSQARLAQDLNFCLLDIGHFYSEKFGISVLGRYLEGELNKAGYKVDVIYDEEETGPFTLLK